MERLQPSCSFSGGLALIPINMGRRQPEEEQLGEEEELDAEEQFLQAQCCEVRLRSPVHWG